MLLIFMLLSTISTIACILFQPILVHTDTLEDNVYSNEVTAVVAIADTPTDTLELHMILISE